jgi:hypothetical protein
MLIRRHIEKEKAQGIKGSIVTLEIEIGLMWLLLFGGLDPVLSTKLIFVEV